MPRTPFALATLALAATLASALASAQTTPDASLPFRNPSLTPQQRATDLVHRLTLDEKVTQMGSASLAVPRLGIPAWNWWNEALHGVARAGYATMFPQAIGMAATWDTPLLHQIGDTVSTEARAKYNEAVRHDNHEIFYGLSFWSPNVNIFRDPRWGRGQETYGEDPFLTGQLAVQFVQGLQGTDPTYLKVVGTPKHFAVHSGPESQRHKFNVDPSKHDLWDTYLPQFRAAIVDGHADSIMCAYNAIDGKPACGSTFLLQDVLRKDWGFKGYVTSDCGAIDDFYMKNTHQTEPDAAHADATSILAGTDTECGGSHDHLAEAVHQGLISEAAVDQALIRLYEARIRLGAFDPAGKNPYDSIPFSAVHSPAAVALTRRSASESFVLLKNDGILPLSASKYKRIAVVGPNAANLASLEGNYQGTPVNPILPVDALTSALRGAHITYAPGAPLVDGFTMPVPRTLLHPAPGSKAEGLKAEYFAGPALSGTPAHTSTDQQINFDWDNVNPLPGSPAGGFAVRWSGTLAAPAAGTYTYKLTVGGWPNHASERSYRVLVDGKEVASSTPPPAADPNAKLETFTGEPTDPAEEKPATFDLTFAANEQKKIEIQFIRRSTQHGSGITLAFTPHPGDLLQNAVEAARNSDLTIAFLGLSPDLEGEEMPVKLPGFAGGDRTDIALPASQNQLLQQLTATGKPVVVVLLNGSALAVPFAADHSNALLEAWYPGEAGGPAIADALLGVTNPSGRLPLTFYRSESDLPAFTDYSMHNRTYRYFTGSPLFPFGYGLSYTRFTYSPVKLSTGQLHAGDTLTATVDVTNSGSRPGEEVAELYLVPPTSQDANQPAPRLTLQGFQRVSLRPGEHKTLTFTLPPRALSLVDSDGNRSVQPGTYRLSIAGAQPDLASANALPTFTIQGSTPIPH